MRMRVTHVGGPTVLVEVGGWRLLTDPTFDAAGGRYTFGWGTASRKLTAPAVGVDAVGAIDAVLLSHDQHGDNLDHAGRALLASAGRVLTTRPAARRLGGRAVGLAPWETATMEAPGRPAIRVTATPARHGPPLSRPIVGAATGFALEWEGQRHGAVWVSGDTVLYRGLRAIRGRLAVGTALVHLGGVRFPISGPLRYTMTARDAAELCAGLAPATVIPVHYEGWQHFREGRAQAERAFAAAPEAVRRAVRWLEPGHPAEIEA